MAAVTRDIINSCNGGSGTVFSGGTGGLRSWWRLIVDMLRSITSRTLVFLLSGVYVMGEVCATL